MRSLICNDLCYDELRIDLKVVPFLSLWRLYYWCLMRLLVLHSFKKCIEGEVIPPCVDRLVTFLERRGSRRSGNCLAGCVCSVDPTMFTRY